VTVKPVTVADALIRALRSPLADPVLRSVADEMEARRDRS
jgi:hypothetical protein